MSEMLSEAANRWNFRSHYQWLRKNSWVRALESGQLSKLALADWPKLITGAGQAPRTPTGVRIWCGRLPGVARYRSHTPGYHPRTPPACKSPARRAGRRVAPGGAQATPGVVHSNPHTPPAGKRPARRAGRRVAPGGAQATPGVVHSTSTAPRRGARIIWTAVPS